jgi:putative chitinase
MVRDANQWLQILLRCQVKAAVAADWAEVFARVVGENSFSQGDAEIDDFLGQILHESAGLTQFTENLQYSAERLCAVWPKRFPTLQEARPYAYNPEALANRVYGGRMGNVALGDGWKYRGRTPIQLTGKDGYRHVGDLMGVDLVSNPEQLSQPDNALQAAIHWWEDRIPDSMIGDPEKVTERVNGGLIGLVDRTHRTDLARAALDGEGVA